MLASSAVLLAGGVCAERIGREFIPPNHWAYGAVERFEALGYVSLPSEGIFTRDNFVKFVETIEANIDEGSSPLTPRERFNLDRLRAEFLGDQSLTNPDTRFDPPVLFYNEKQLYFEADADLSIQPVKPRFDDRWWVFGGSNLSARAHFGKWVTYDLNYRLTYGPERDEWAHKNKPTSRTRSWNGLTALYERAYLSFGWKALVLYWGRDYSDWGANDTGNLHVSDTAGSLDKIGGRVVFKNIRLSFFHGWLSTADPQRTFSAHRLEFDAWKFTVGLSESVVYTGRGIDPVYLLPVSAFYSNQYNERGDDNILWSVDLKYRVRPGFVLYGGLLIDDFQFERTGTAPDKLGFDLGSRVAVGGPAPMTLNLRYRYVDIYTYTHRDSLKYHVGSAGDPLADDLPLGAVQGPDTDFIKLAADYYPLAAVTVSGFVSHLRRGEGNDWRAHTRDLDPSPPFPSGVVEKTLTVGLGLLWELNRNSRVSIEISHSTVGNRENVAGDDDDSTGFRGFAVWDF
jgi:hypothetical protein